MTTYRPTLKSWAGDPASGDPESWSEGPPAASVIVAVYNAEDYLQRLVQQLVTLDHPSFEVILVDDGSTDGTMSQLQTLDALPFPLLVLSLETNYGVAAARNLALSHANGEYVWMVDGDDQWPPAALSILCDAANKASADLVIAQATRVVAGSGRRTRIPAPPVAGMLDRDNLVVAYMRGDVQGQLWNKLFSLRLLVGHGEVFPRMPSKSDVCGLIPILDRVETAVAISDDVYTYEFHSGSIATSKAKPLDLLRVAELSFRQFGGTAPRGALLDLFWIRSIAKPLLTEIWRFDDRSPAGQYAARVALSGLGIATAMRLAVAGELRDAGWSIVLRYGRVLVRGIYRWRRSKEWVSPGEVRATSSTAEPRP